jgi:hypothetical protein
MFIIKRVVVPVLTPDDYTETYGPETESFVVVPVLTPDDYTTNLEIPCWT